MRDRRGTVLKGAGKGRRRKSPAGMGLPRNGNDAWTEVIPLLRDLPPSGTGSFEEFSADALAEVAGLSFRLMKSGAQGGADGLSDASIGFVFAMEAKRYALGTRLALDSLRAKLNDLAHEHPAAELWILVATREVSAGDEKALRATGDGLGIDVLVLDTRPGATGVPPLLVLCAAAPQSMRRHWPGSDELMRLLDALHAAPGFAEALGALRRRLRSPDVGHEPARRALAGWMRSAMSDLIRLA